MDYAGMYYQTFKTFKTFSLNATVQEVSRTLQLQWDELWWFWLLFLIPDLSKALTLRTEEELSSATDMADRS